MLGDGEDPTGVAEDSDDSGRSRSMNNSGSENESESEESGGPGRSCVRGRHVGGRGRAPGGGRLMHVGRGGASLGARGRGRGESEVGTTSRSDDGLTARERAVLVEGWKNKDNSFTRFPFVSPMPGPSTPSTGESAKACFCRFFTDLGVGPTSYRDQPVYGAM